MGIVVMMTMMTITYFHYKRWLDIVTHFIESLTANLEAVVTPVFIIKSL